MSEIFISYRRNDSADVTGRIRHDLANTFGADRVFNDVYSIRKGQNFREAVLEAIGKCKAYLVVIGPRWLEKSGENGKTRLEEEDDNVRLEVEAALAKPGLPIIPLLVRGATMPDRRELPESLQQLSYLNGMKIRPGTDYDRDIEDLISAISDLGVKKKSSGDSRSALLRGLGVVAAIAILVALGTQLPTFDSDKPATPRPGGESITPRPSDDSTNSQPKGASKRDIRNIQTLLNSIEFDAGTPDGEFGRSTRRAISAFQRTYGVPVSGELSSQLISQLNDAKASGFSNVMCDVVNDVEQDCRNVPRTRSVPDVQTQSFDLENQTGCFYNMNVYCNAFNCDWASIEDMCEADQSGQAQLAQQCQIQFGGILEDYDATCTCGPTYCGCEISGSCEKQISTSREESFSERVCEPRNVTREVCRCRAPEVCPPGT